MDTLNPASSSFPAPSYRILPVRHTGKENEYFRIWIVNVALSVLTLGIYSAWAKVRTRQYLYRNTWIDGVHFDYTAEPVQILKGRLLIAAVLGALALLELYAPPARVLMTVCIIALLPWLVVRAFAFNARHTVYRNTPLEFRGTVAGAYREAVIAGAIIVLTLGVGLPYARWRVSSYLLTNHRYGDLETEWLTPVRSYFRIYWTAACISALGGLLLVFALSLLMFSIGEMAPLLAAGSESVWFLVVGIMVGVNALLGAFLYAYVEAHIANLVYGGLTLGKHCYLASEQEPWALYRVLLASGVLVLATAGLLTPWAIVRLARYRAECLEVHVKGPLVPHRQDRSEAGSALGDAALDLGDLDFGVGF